MIIPFIESLGITNITTLSGFHNQIFEGQYNDDAIIIRVSHRRSKEEILEEVHVLNTIKHAVNIAEPYAINNDYVLSYDHKAVAFFKKIDGLNWHETTLTDETHYNAGRALGTLHQALQKISNITRQSYDKHPDIKLLYNLDPIYQKQAETLLSQLKKDDKHDNEFGLIHGDYLFSNLLYHGKDMTIIDFDDIEYNYYLYDIAVYLFYLILGGNPADIDIQSNKNVFKNFIKGYRKVNPTTVLDFDKIHMLFKLRQLKLLATIKTTYNPNNYGPWQKAYIALCNNQFKHNENFIDIDYTTLLTI
ncbi:MAG: phosphotransferase enzyme family protein [Bacillota bacterium]